ncbi:MAG: glycosyltransferase [Oscillospiraceae bacterium]|nr:glycosyltransferase [Oscillospiraceae bacterium]
MPDENIKISVLVPVYNVARFLPRCLDSLAAQSLRDIEILLIDDGSTDDSAAICADYVARDGRFRLLRQENRGLSAVRNRHLEEARGEYLLFVDSDDWVAPDFCEAPWRCARAQDADLVLFGFRHVTEEGEPLPLKGSLPQGPIDRETALRLLLTGPSFSYVWNKLWKKSLFHGLRFPEGRMYEDVAVTYLSVLRAERIVSLPQVLYYYRKRKGSAVSLRTDKAMEDYSVMYGGRYHGLKELGCGSPALETHWAEACLTYAKRRAKDPADPFSLECRKALREMKRIPGGIRRRRRMQILLLRVCPPLFELGCRLRGTRKKQ